MAIFGPLAPHELRAFPFLTAVPRTLAGPGGGGRFTLPDDAVVDYRDVIDATLAGAIPGLARVARAGTTLTFHFGGPGPLAGLDLAFVADAATIPEFGRVHATATGQGATVGAPCPAEPAWAGILTVGRLATLLSHVPDGGSVTADGGTIAVEPTLTRGAPPAVRSINLANRDRLQATAPASCGGPTGPPAARGFTTVATCLVGDVRVLAGVNCILSEDPAAGALVIGAADGAGTGRPCGEPSRFPGETPPAGSALLSGGPACGQVIGGVNGVTPPSGVLRLIDGAGFLVVADPDRPHVLILDLTSRPAGGC